MNAIEELFTKLGFDRRALWVASVVFWGLFVSTCVLAVYVPKTYIVAVLAFYLVTVALPLLFAPAFWLLAGGAFAIAGQFGREQGLSFRDAFDAVKEYGTPILNKAGYALLVAIPIWFIAMIFLNTEGVEQYVLLGLILLPTTIYLVVRRWPDGKTFEAVTRTTLLVFVLGIVGLLIYNTVNRATVSPATLEVQTYEERLAKNQQTFEAELARDLRKKVEAKRALTADEEKAWNDIRAQAHAQSNAGRVQALVTTVADAKPTDANWWKAHWYLPAGAIVAIVVLLWWFGRTATGTAGATPTVAGAHASAGTTSPRTKWFKRLIALTLIGWCWYSISEGVGQPGKWIADRNYERTLPLTIRDMNDQQLCGIRPGSWHFSFPGEQRREYEARFGRSQAVGIFVRSQNGLVNRYSVVSNILVNDTFSGKEPVTVGPDGCVTVSFFSPAEFKKTAVVLGGDLVNNEKPTAFAPNAPAQPYTTLIRFVN